MSATIKLIQINNETDVGGLFTNLETAEDNIAVGAKCPTNTPGQFGDGCNIPDCGAGRWWDSHRMTLSLEGAVLSLWKEGRNVYCRLGQTVYPGVGRGEFLWADNGIPVVLNIAADSTATMLNP